MTGVDRNTAVNLSFDLLGFGQDNSHVTLRDIRVSGLPQLHDDAASLPEDNLLTFDPFTQSDAQLKPLLASHIVDVPTHGAVTVNADGTFAYTPNLDYFGTDSFSYRLSDGPLDSNLAIVSITVTPVNDAPVAADASVTLAEDGMVIIDLMAYASDVDNLPHPLPNPPFEGAGADTPLSGEGWDGGGVAPSLLMPQSTAYSPRTPMAATPTRRMRTTTARIASPIASMMVLWIPT